MQTFDIKQQTFCQIRVRHNEGEEKFLNFAAHNLRFGVNNNEKKTFFKIRKSFQGKNKN